MKAKEPRQILHTNCYTWGSNKATTHLKSNRALRLLSRAILKLSRRPMKKSAEVWYSSQGLCWREWR